MNTEIENSTPDISIVIVNYNVRDLLKACLLSIRQASKNLKVETIVVDNHSQDKSVEFLEPQFTEVKFIALPENIGFARANNIAIRQVKSKYTLILNPDTILGEDTLIKMYNYMEQHPEVWISGCKVLNKDLSFQIACRRGFPTPFASFSKLYGLQSLFPKSKLFGKYNQTFRSIDETYYVDAIMGAFMFARTKELQFLNGFDEDFFMYGEDLDLCYRVYKGGGKIAYFHETSIIHYKGESTKRSSINYLKHFYEAMVIFVQKHFAKSKIFVLFLKLGIFLRFILAHLFKYSKEYPLILVDSLIIICSLLISTKIRFGEFLSFPDYAYPTVFIVVVLVYFGSLFSVGEYFEGEHSLRKVLYGSMISFFFLSALTYFFKSYAFSRGVLLMTITFTLIFSSILRLLIAFVKSLQKESEVRKIALIGNLQSYSLFYNELSKYQNGNFEILGRIITSTDSISDDSAPVLGNLELMTDNFDQFGINELIVCERNENVENLILQIHKHTSNRIYVHYAETFNEFIVSDIINKISNRGPNTQHKLLLPRYRLAKRSSDIIISLLAFTIFLPITFIKSGKNKKLFKDLLQVLKGNKSFIGIYPQNYIRNFNAKPGILNLANFLPKEQITDDIVHKLNDYYEQNYSLSLDFDIFLKSIISF